MIKLSKKVEYALMALSSIKNSGENIMTAKEISAEHNIPYDLLAKILQKLKKEDILMTRTGNTGIVVTDVEGVFHNNFFKHRL